MASAASLCRQMLRVLEQERAALLTANFAALSALVVRKEKLLPALNRLDPAQLDPQVQVGLRRNQALLQASMAGLRDARAAIIGLQTPAEFRTYDSRGTSMAVAAPRASAPHRA